MLFNIQQPRLAAFAFDPDQFFNDHPLLVIDTADQILKFIARGSFVRPQSRNLGFDDLEMIAGILRRWQPFPSGLLI